MGAVQADALLIKQQQALPASIKKAGAGNLIAKEPFQRKNWLLGSCLPAKR
jgi:hypothetical protein